MGCNKMLRRGESYKKFLNRTCANIFALQQKAQLNANRTFTLTHINLQSSSGWLAYLNSTDPFLISSNQKECHHNIDHRTGICIPGHHHLWITSRSCRFIKFPPKKTGLFKLAITISVSSSSSRSKKLNQCSISHIGLWVLEIENTISLAFTQPPTNGQQ